MQDGPRESLEAQFSDMYGSDWKRENFNTIWDYQLDTRTWEVVGKSPLMNREGPHAPLGMEFPQLNRSYVGKKNRYTYVLAVDFDRDDKKGGKMLNCIQKYDSQSGVVKTFELPPGQVPGDTYFIPRKGGVAEDDGYLVSFVYEAERHRSSVLVLDAKTFEGPAVAVVKLLSHVPLHFHGCWAPKV